MGQVDPTEATLAQESLDAVAADVGRVPADRGLISPAYALGLGVPGTAENIARLRVHGFSRCDGRLLQETAGLAVQPEQAFDPPAEVRVAAASLGQVGVPLGRVVSIQGSDEQVEFAHDIAPGSPVHHSQPRGSFPDKIADSPDGFCPPGPARQRPLGDPVPA